MSLKAMKVAVLASSRRLGLLTAVGRSQWRTHRLLVLAYHGISQNDEHVWNPALYMSPDALRRRSAHFVPYMCFRPSHAETIGRLARAGSPSRAVAPPALRRHVVLSLSA